MLRKKPWLASFGRRSRMMYSAHPTECVRKPQPGPFPDVESWHRISNLIRCTHNLGARGTYLVLRARADCKRHAHTYQTSQSTLTARQRRWIQVAISFRLRVPSVLKVGCAHGVFRLCHKAPWVLQDRVAMGISPILLPPSFFHSLALKGSSESWYPLSPRYIQVYTRRSVDFWHQETFYRLSLPSI